MKISCQIVKLSEQKREKNALNKTEKECIHSGTKRLLKDSIDMLMNQHLAGIHEVSFVRASNINK